MSVDRSLYEPSPWAVRYHQCAADQVLGGGSAGLGKSLSLLWDPIVSQAVVEQARMTGQFLDQFAPWLAELCVKHPIRKGESEGHALHMRRSMPQLKENIQRSIRMFPKFDPGAVYSKEDHTWTFTTGYKFTFGHCREADSHLDYLSKQFCVAEGTRIVMGDGSLRAIEDIRAGEMVQTLEGPRRVTFTWDSGVKHCVGADVYQAGDYVGTQVHPSTHPVLLCPNAQSPFAARYGSHQSVGKGWSAIPVWHDYESLLCGLPESPVMRVSGLSAEDASYAASHRSRLESEQLPTLSVPAVLHEPTLRLNRRNDSMPIGSLSDAKPPVYYSRSTTGQKQPVSSTQRGHLPSAAASLRSPGVYRNFYTRKLRPVRERTCQGSAELSYVGMRQTYDLTVEGANHYITETGMVNLQTHLALDESWTFLFNQFEELDARVRSADPVLRLLLRTRLMSNPAPGWLKREFVDPEPGGNVELRRKITDPDTGETRIKTRIFLPGTLDDNPDKAFAADYKFKLLSKPAHMRARYLYGDWDSAEGAFFEDDWNPSIHVMKPHPETGRAFKIPRDWPKFRSMDWGYRSQGVICWFALDPDDVLICFYEFNFRLMTDEVCAIRVMEIEKQLGFWNVPEKRSRLTGVADTQLWEERGNSGVSMAAKFAEHGVYWQPADKTSMQRNAERVSARLRDHDKDRIPGLQIYENCKKTREMFASLGCDPNDSGVPDKRSPLKHWFDVQAYAAARASQGRASITMDMHAFDAQDREEEPVARKSAGFGYGA